MRKHQWKQLNYKPWREGTTRCVHCDSVRRLLSSLIWLPTDNGRNALSPPRNKETRARNSSWLLLLSSVYNWRGKHRPPLTQVCEMTLRSRQRMLSHWPAFSTVEVTVHLFPGPQAQDYFFSPLHSFNNSLESLRQLTWGQTENLVLPFNLHLRNQIKIQLLSITFYLHFCLCSRKLQEKEIQKVPISQCLAFKIKLTLPLLNSISTHTLQLCNIYRLIKWANQIRQVKRSVLWSICTTPST